MKVYQTRLNGVWYGAAAQGRQVFATYFSVEQPDINRLLKSLPAAAQFQIIEKPDELLAEVVEALDKIFRGKDAHPQGFRLATGHLSGYTKKVLNYTSKVPVGYVTTYGALAKAAGGSARSVGRVQATNPFPLLVPCHRVVCSDMKLGGYGYGKDVKRQILGREERGYEESNHIDVDGKNLALFPAEWVKPV